MTQSEDRGSLTLAGGVEIPLVGFGTWEMVGSRCYEAVRIALDAGYRLIDTATMYGNEDEVGRAVRDSGLDRREVFITTKLPSSRAGHEQQTLIESLRALRTDYVDLWLVHWPPGGQARPSTWERLVQARANGQARAVGVSNYSTGQLDELIAATGQAPEVNQIPWAPALYDAKRQAEHRERGIVLEGYSPFNSSDLRHRVLVEIAAARGVSPAQVVLRWHLEHEVVVIPKSTTPERIRSNLDVFGFTLTENEITRLDALSSH